MYVYVRLGMCDRQVSFIFPFSFVPFVVINWPPRLAAVKFVLMVRNADQQSKSQLFVRSIVTYPKITHNTGPKTPRIFVL